MSNQHTPETICLVVTTVPIAFEDSDKDDAYDKIDRHLRNSLDDTEYAEYSAALETVADCLELTKQRDEHVKEIGFLKREIDELLAKKFARFANDECWIYQGDGDDHLESLVCPVVISANRLLQIEKQRDELLEKIAKYDRRIVAIGGIAINSIPRDSYGGMVVTQAAMIVRIQNQNYELMAALESMLSAYVEVPQTVSTSDATDKAYTAIASVKGGAA